MEVTIKKCQKVICKQLKRLGDKQMQEDGGTRWTKELGLEWGWGFVEWRPAAVGQRMGMMMG